MCRLQSFQGMASGNIFKLSPRAYREVPLTMEAKISPQKNVCIKAQAPEKDEMRHTMAICPRAPVVPSSLPPLPEVRRFHMETSGPVSLDWQLFT